MNSSIPKYMPLEIVHPMKLLLVFVFVAASGLSVKTAYDLATYSVMFPMWFVPGFILGIAILLTLSSYFVLQTLKTSVRLDLPSRRQSIFLWGALTISFICTTSVHGFYPFHFNTLSMLSVQDPVMKINFAVAITGFIACILLSGLYMIRLMRLPAMTGLMIVALILLIPNDNCANPFNYWWIDRIGASPLMYVPNMFAALFTVCGLSGIHPRIVSFVLSGVCVASLALGLGHQVGIIW